MSLNPSPSPAPSFFHHQASTMFPKFLDGSFNGNSTSTNFSGGNTVRPKSWGTWWKPEGGRRTAQEKVRDSKTFL